MGLNRQFILLLVLVTLLHLCVGLNHDSNHLRNNLKRWRPEILKNSLLISGIIIGNARKVGLRTVKTFFNKTSNRPFKATLTSVKQNTLKQRQYGPTTTTTAPITDTTTTATSTTTTAISTTTVRPNTDAYSFPDRAVIAAIATAIAVSVAMTVPQSNLPTLISNSTLPFIPNVPQTFQVNNNMPIRGSDYPDDGCGNFSVRFDNDQCHPILKRGPCVATHWVVVNPQTLKGQCSPRLCGRRRVYIGRTELCHDVYDPLECRDGRRLFYSAYGDPICDCPIGQYAFPTSQDDCVPLFTKGPCLAGFQVTIVPGGELGCTPAAVPPIDADNSRVQRVVTSNGSSFVLGSRGPCPSTSQILGYDIFKREIQCVDTSDPTSPYFSSAEEEALLDQIFHQFYPDYNEILPVMIYRNSIESETANRRQGENTIGLLQVPSVLLAPCRTGAQRELNFKCVNPIIPERKPTEILPAVQSKFQCPGTLSLKVTGQCVSSSTGNSCGPSFQFSPETGQCRFRNTVDF